MFLVNNNNFLRNYQKYKKSLITKEAKIEIK